MKLFSTEQISKYHPDKFCDIISDAIVTECLKQDPQSRVACEVMAKDYTIVLGGEIRTNAVVDYGSVAQRVADKLGYTIKSIINLIGEQSNEIYQGTTQANELVGAGDQGIMFGFATNETDSMLPYAFDMANKIIAKIEADIENNPSTILKGDAKTQITTDLDKPQDISALTTILVSVCHKEGYALDNVKEYIQNLLSPLLNAFKGTLLINPAGTWTIGGPVADCGLTGRKIVCDQYGGFTPVGGGAFSGKDPSKVDRSAAYMAREIAKDVINNFCNSPTYCTLYQQKPNTCQVQLAYAIGKAEPVSVRVDIDGENAPQFVYNYVHDKYDLTPKGIIDSLGLLNKDYEKLAAGCHFREGL